MHHGFVNMVCYIHFTDSGIIKTLLTDNNWIHCYLNSCYILIEQYIPNSSE